MAGEMSYQEALKVLRDHELKRYQEAVQREYQAKLADPATVDEALVWLRERMDDGLEWSALMVSRLYLEVMILEIERLRGPVLSGSEDQDIVSS